MQNATRRDFLGNLGHGMLLTCVGPSLASSLGAMTTERFVTHQAGVPIDLERLVRAMQETAPDELMVKLTKELANGTALPTLVGAGALANARTFGGHDYDGYHAQMALLPAYHMAQQMPESLRALPVLKVLYRSSARIQKAGGGRERLQPIDAEAVTGDSGKQLRQHMRGGAMEPAERLFHGMCNDGLASAYDGVQTLVRDDLNVHRITLAWRAWDMLQLLGEEHAHTMLRQCVRFCVDHEQTRMRKSQPVPTVRAVLPKLLDQHRLLGREPGTRRPDDAWLEQLSVTVFGESRERGADAVAAALAEGFDPEAVAEAISLAANQLLLHDTGAKRVHGASVGVHASDAANAWRNIARVGPHATRTANLIVAAYHTSGQSHHVGKQPYAFDEQLAKLTSKEPAKLLAALESAIENRDQRAACAVAHRYGELALPPEPMFKVLLRYAVSQDGALHAEKYYHTVHEEYGRTRPALRWRRVVALSRVTASEYGEPAPGDALSRRLLQS